MGIELRQRLVDGGEPSSWLPEEWASKRDVGSWPDAPGYKFDWRDIGPRPNDPTRDAFLEACANGVSIARIQLDYDDPSGAYQSPVLPGPVVEVQFIDVVESHRGQGVGREVIRQISDGLPGFNLVALSEDADGFWESLGWTRYLHRNLDPRAPGHYRPMYVQNTP